MKKWVNIRDAFKKSINNKRRLQYQELKRQHKKLIYNAQLHSSSIGQYETRDEKTPQNISKIQFTEEITMDSKKTRSQTHKIGDVELQMIQA